MSNNNYNHDAKIFILQSLCNGDAKFKSLEDKEVFNTLSSIFKLNDKSILKNTRLADLQKFAEFIAKEKDVSEDSIIQIRQNVISYISNNQLSTNSDSVLEKVKNFNIELTKTGSIDKNLVADVLEFVKYEIVCYTADVVEYTASQKSGSVNLFFLPYTDYKTIVLNAFIESANKVLSEKNTIDIDNISYDINSICKKIKEKGVSVADERLKELHSIDMETIRQREMNLIKNEEKLELDKTKVIELERKNLEFSKILEKKSIEINSRLDALETTKSCLDEFKSDMLSLAHRIIKICEKI